MNNLNRFTKKNQKWINAAMLALLMFICLGFCSSNKSLYLTAITDALGIKRSIFSLATSCRYIATAAINIFFSRLVMKFGTKKLILAGICSLIVSMILNSIASSVSLFFVAEIFAGIGFSWSGTTIVGCVVNRWFDTDRGKINGAILCVNGLGGAVAAQIVSPLIYSETNVFGYRDAYRLIAVILAVLFFVVFVLFKEKRDNGPSYASIPKKKNSNAQRWSGITYSDAKKRPYFYGAALCIFLVGMILQGAGGIFHAQMLDRGLNPQFVASTASISSLLLAVSKFLTGFMYDKFGLRVTITISCISAVLQMFFLTMVAPNTIGMIIGVAATVFQAVALPLETVMLPIYANDFFGDKDYDKIMSMFVSFNMLGYACGSPMFNIGYDLTGSYKSILIITGILMIATVIMLQFVISAAHKVRRQIEASEAQGEI